MYTNLSKHFPNKDLTIDLTKRETGIRILPALKTNFLNNNIAYVDAFVNAKAGLVLGYCIPNTNITDAGCTRSISVTGTHIGQTVNAGGTGVCIPTIRTYTCNALNFWY